MTDNSNELAIKNALDFFGETLPANVWFEKYALRNKKTNELIETHPNQTIQRIVNEVHRIEQKYPNPIPYNEIQELFDHFKHFIFGGSIIYGLGNNESFSSLGNCFFVDNGSDSYGGIVNLDEQAVQLMKRRGGVGISLDNLRPSNATTKNSANTSSGAVSFINRYSHSTGEVAQSGRRGALMVTMSVEHPDSPLFAVCKSTEGNVEFANISLKLSDNFLRAAEEDKDYILKFPIDMNIDDIDVSNYNYDELVSIGNNKYVKKIKAKQLFDLVCKMAWSSAEPGCLFWDKIISESVPDCYSKYGIKTKGTNPCGEICLYDKGKCLLGSINLYNFVENPFTENATFNRSKFEEYVSKAIRVMDDMIDVEIEKTEAIINKIKNDPEAENIKRTELELWKGIQQVANNLRHIGTGYMGLADMLAALNIKYCSEEGNKFVADIAKMFAVVSHKTNIELAKERGAFPFFEYELEQNNPYLNRVNQALVYMYGQEKAQSIMNDYKQYGRRCVATSALAPTGTTSIIGSCSSGIEPVFKCFYRRRKKVNIDEVKDRTYTIDNAGIAWEEYNVVHPKFKVWCEMNNIDFSKMSVYELEETVKRSPFGMAESHDIDWVSKVHMQGEIQKWIDNSISITHNLPKTATIEDVKEIYREAWKSGCKGATVYRDGSRTGILNSTETKESKFIEHNAPKRPKTLECDFYILSSRGKRYGIAVGLLDGKPYEIFAYENPQNIQPGKGSLIRVKKGHYDLKVGNDVVEKIHLASYNLEEKYNTIYISMLLRHGAPLSCIIDIIEKVDDNIVSFSSVVRRILNKYIPNEIVNGEKCPMCGGDIIKIDGCKKCVNSLAEGEGSCTFSKC